MCRILLTLALHIGKPLNLLGLIEGNLAGKQSIRAGRIESEPVVVAIYLLFDAHHVMLYSKKLVSKFKEIILTRYHALDKPLTQML